MDKFIMEFDKFIASNSIREIPAEEMKAWVGPVLYVPMQLVINPDSATTPFRIVTNSSCKDPKTKKSLNCILAKGPSLLSDQWQIMVRYRNYKYVLATDVTKAYHQL
jgi:hypothetical protein